MYTVVLEYSTLVLKFPKYTTAVHIGSVLNLVNLERKSAEFTRFFKVGMHEDVKDIGIVSVY